MLKKTPLNIRGDPGIYRIVGTEYHVDLPFHRYSPAIRTASIVSRLLAFRFLTAIASALGWPMIVISFFPLVTAV
jgi:hypothetical protein